MAHRRSLFHHWRSVIAILLIVATPLRAQTQKPEEAFALPIPTYLQLLDGYRRYDSEATRDLRVFWERFERVHEKVLSLFIQMVPREVWPISVMALTDLGFDASARGDKKLGDRHLRIAGRWVDQILEVNPSPSMPMNRFARKWYLAVIWQRFVRFERSDAEELLERARELFPNDPEVLLSSGSLEEMELTFTRLLRGPRTGREVTSNFGVFAPEMQMIKASGYFREAIRLDPGNAEARIRLAWLRTVSQTMDFSGGLTLLKEARALAPKPPLSYLAALFSGRIEEELKHLDAAASWYRTAIAECPLAQTARLGLSHVQLDQDEIVSSRNTLRPLIHSSRTLDYACEPDPWNMYEFGQAWRRTDWIAAMRKEVREPMEGSQP